MITKETANNIIFCIEKIEELEGYKNYLIASNVAEVRIHIYINSKGIETTIPLNEAIEIIDKKAFYRNEQLKRINTKAKQEAQNEDGDKDNES